MKGVGVDPSQLWTIPAPPAGRWSALDPLACEQTWAVWSLDGADPSIADHGEVAAHLRAWTDELLELLHDPGRLVVTCQVSTSGGSSPKLDVLLGVMVAGAPGTSRAEGVAAAKVAAAVAARRPHFPYELNPVAPRRLLEEGPRPLHTSLIRQRTVLAELDDGAVEVVSRFNPVFDPLGRVAEALLGVAAPTAVRVTALASALDGFDLERLDAERSQLTRAAQIPGAPRRTHRALATLADLVESFSTPVYLGEVAVFSEAPLERPVLRLLAGAMTSELDVVRRGDRVVVAPGEQILGGYELDRDPPALPEALAQGVPLRGGLVERELRDVLSLTELPLVLPIPRGKGIPTIPSWVPPAMELPAELRHGTYVGRAADGTSVYLPDSQSNRHSLVLGDSGSGKSRFLAANAVRALAASRPVLVLDPHGSLADLVVEQAGLLGAPISVLGLGGDCQLELLPALEHGGANLAEVELAAGQFADAVMSTMPKDWSGPRWRQATMCVTILSAALQVPFDEAVTIYADHDLRQRCLRDVDLPPVVERHLRLLAQQSEDDRASLVDWVISKFDPFANGASRQLLSAPGRGTDLRRAVVQGRSIVVNLQGLTTAEVSLLGTLVLSQAIDGARVAKRRSSFELIVDEVPLFHPRQLASILTEARKFNLVLTLAAQSFRQFADDSMRDAAASAGIKLAFRQSAISAPTVADLVEVPAIELRRQPDLHCFLKVGQFDAVPVQLPPYPVAGGLDATALQMLAEEATPGATAPVAERTTTDVNDGFKDIEARAAQSTRPEGQVAPWIADWLDEIETLGRAC